MAAFQSHGFNTGNLDNGGAIMMHDALLTAAKAVERATPEEPSGEGNPIGKPIPVLQYPPPAGSPSRQVALYVTD